MKKIISLLSSMAICIGSTVLPANAAGGESVYGSGDEIVKNQSYFYSLSDDEVYSEYIEAIELTGDPCLRYDDTLDKDELKRQIIDASNNEIKNGSLDPNRFRIDFDIPLTNEEACSVRDKSDRCYGGTMEYLGFDKSPYADISLIPQLGTYKGATVKNYLIGNYIDVYDYMRNILAFYNSQFYKDYEGNGITVEWNLLCDVSSPYISGDANCNGTVDLADAVLIMQNLSNPDKYPLSDIGEVNADVEGDDGITAKDALAIQRQLLGIKD